MQKYVRLFLSVFKDLCVAHIGFCPFDKPYNVTENSNNCLYQCFECQFRIDFICAFLTCYIYLTYFCMDPLITS